MPQTRFLQAFSKRSPNVLQTFSKSSPNVLQPPSKGVRRG
jgi:hypothetical protein